MKTSLDGGKKETTVFQCNRWLDTNEDDGKIERDLYPYIPGQSINYHYLIK